MISPIRANKEPGFGRVPRGQNSSHRAFVWGASLLLALGLLTMGFFVSPIAPGAISLAGVAIGAALVAGAELNPAELPLSSHVMSFTLAIDIALLVLYGPYTAILAYLIGIVVAALVAGQSVYFVVHHFAENGLPMLIGGAVLWVLAPPGIPHSLDWELLVFVLAVFSRMAADLGLSIVHAWIDGSHSAVSPVRAVLGGYAYLPLLVLAPIGLLAAYCVKLEPALLVFLFGPFLAQYVTLQRQASLVERTDTQASKISELRRELDARTNDLNQAISQLQRRLSQSYSLQAVGAAITQELDLERVLPVIARQSARLAGGDGAFITLLTDDREHQFIRAAYGPHLSDFVGRDLAFNASLTGEVIKTGRPQIANSALSDARVDQQVARQAHITAVLEAPLKVKDRILGVLGVVAHGGKRFDQEDMRLVTVLANQAAIAIDNARLHERQTELAVFRERNRLARELHDSVTQSLFSIGLYLQTITQRVQDDPEQALELLKKTQEIAQDAQAEMRSLIFELRPTAVRNKGLDFALENLISLVRRRNNIEVDFRKEGERDVPANVELALYRVTQEALNNVTKHAEASRVWVDIEFRDHMVKLTIRDNGKGFDVDGTQAESQLSFGLTSMRERVTALGGQLELKSRPGEGTTIRARIPITGGD